MITTLREWWMDSVNLASRPIVLPSSQYFSFGIYNGRSFPCTSSIANIISLKPQQIERYSFPIGWDFRGMNIEPGQVHMNVKTERHGLIQTRDQLGLKQACVCLLKASIRLLTGWNGCLNAGRAVMLWASDASESHQNNFWTSKHADKMGHRKICLACHLTKTFVLALPVLLQRGKESPWTAETHPM